jgi:hypothetical protein
MGDVRRIELKQEEVGGELIYTVTKLQNTVNYTIGQELNQQQVKELCNYTSVEVTIK